MKKKEKDNYSEAKTVLKIIGLVILGIGIIIAICLIFSQ